MGEILGIGCSHGPGISGPLMGRTVETERRASERVAKNRSIRSSCSNRSNRQNLPENNPKSPPPADAGEDKGGG